MIDEPITSQSGISLTKETPVKPPPTNNDIEKPNSNSMVASFPTSIQSLYHPFMQLLFKIDSLDSSCHKII